MVSVIFDLSNLWCPQEGLVLPFLMVICAHLPHIICHHACCLLPTMPRRPHVPNCSVQRRPLSKKLRLWCWKQNREEAITTHILHSLWFDFVSPPWYIWGFPKNGGTPKSSILIANFPLWLVPQKSPCNPQKSSIKCRKNNIFWWLMGAFFGEPTEVEIFHC